MSHGSYSLHGHSSTVDCLAFSPDGRLLASGSWDRTVKIWDVTTKRLVRTLGGHPAWVRGIAFSPDGGRLAAVGDGGFVRVWDVATGMELAKLSGRNEMIWHVVFSPDGRRLATVEWWGGALYVWDLQSQKAVWTRQPERGRVGVHIAAFGSDGQRLAFNMANQLQVWDVVQGKEVLVSKGDSNLSRTIVYSLDGEHIVYGSADGTIRFLDAVSGKELRTYRSFAKSVDHLAFGDDGRRLLSVHGSTMKLWDTVTGQEVWNWNTGDRASLRGYPESAPTSMIQDRQGVMSRWPSPGS